MFKQTLFTIVVIAVIAVVVYIFGAPLLALANL